MRNGLCLLLLLTSFGIASGSDRGKDADKGKAIQKQDQVQKLLDVLKNDRKENHRVSAAEQLGKFSPVDFPEILSALIDAMARDDSTSVRKASIKTLAAFEPPTHEVKQALDQAVNNDGSWSVRQVARIARLRYKPKDEPPTTPEQRKQISSKQSITEGKSQSKQNASSPPVKLSPKPQDDPLKGGAPRSLPLPTPEKEAVPPLPLPDRN